MSKPAIERRDPVARGVALLLGASVLAGLFALPVAATSGPTRLRDPVVEPRLATPGALVTFAVTYRNREGSPADWVRVEVGEMVHDLAPTTAAEDPADWKAGVRFEAVVPAPAVGTYPVVFVSFDSRRFYDRREAGSLTVESPVPTPSLTSNAPSPTAIPAPTPTADAPSPTAIPAPTPTTNPTKPPLGGSGTSGSSGATDGSSGTGGSGSSGGSGASGGSAPVGPSPSPSSGSGSGSVPLGSGGATPSSSPSSGAAPAPSAATGPGPWPGAGTWDPVAERGGSGAPVGPDGSGPVPDPVTASGGDGPAPDRGSASEAEPAAAGDPPAGRLPGRLGGSPATIGAPGRALLDGLGVGTRVSDEVWVASVFVTTAGGAAMAMAFHLFGRRRREDDERPEMQTSAPATVGMPPSSVLVPDPTVPEHERHLPRWRRPSLLEARKTDPLRTQRPTVTLTFGSTPLAPSEGRERRRIRYRLVRLLDAPDEVRANEIGILDQGDEVELIERSGSYWLVLCPDGSRGWLHRMVLGEVVGDGSNGARPAPGTTAGGELSLGPGLLDEILARRPQAGGDRDR